MRRAEVTVLIHAWLEEQDLPGLNPAFRARVTLPVPACTVGVSSVEDLHQRIDDVMADMISGARDAG